jgi:hypothetical protein
MRGVLDSSFELSCARLHSAKTQLIYFHVLPHSLRKNAGVRGYLLEGTAEKKGEKTERAARLASCRPLYFCEVS